MRHAAAQFRQNPVNGKNTFPERRSSLRFRKEAIAQRCCSSAAPDLPGAPASIGSEAAAPDAQKPAAERSAVQRRGKFCIKTIKISNISILNITLALFSKKIAKRANFLLTEGGIFHKHIPAHGQLAQLVEHRLHTAGVTSSSLVLPTTPCLPRNGS